MREFVVLSVKRTTEDIDVIKRFMVLHDIKTSNEEEDAEYNQDLAGQYGRKDPPR
ncbi:hypothetical protein MtrunA17_Chr1g0179121 [Medicago truncatula]|uniref:Uncharacterized protein n=1 Tax=Medicago truncatula TaxID=3880 RepID=A0A072VVF2_MEDTR|nr:hypothetical protein MTR_1g060840 [Medicago truncatula]RHN79601.1 hypothetical protein MtrunA17_Chr1g0179121 [Medicago truncatula]